MSILRRLPLPVLLSPMRYSYLAVVVAVVVELLLPEAAPTVLGPVLLAGLVLLGIAHGACDQLVFPAYRPVRGTRWGYWLRFLLLYLGLAAVVVVGWWAYPALMVGLFFLLTVWHWGSADAPTPLSPALWVSHSVLRGLLLFALPALCWPTPTLHIINGLLTFGGGPPLAPATFRLAAGWLGALVLAGHLVLWLTYAGQRHARRWRTDLQEVLLLGALFGILPPVLALGVYFVFWHSLQHVLRLNRALGYRTAAAGDARRAAWRRLGHELLYFLRRALPLLLLSLGALLVLHHYLAARLTTGAALLSFALVVASVVTLPHALLVSLVMDAPRFRSGEMVRW